MVPLLSPFFVERVFKLLPCSDGGIRQGFEPFSSLSIEGLYKQYHNHIQLFHIYVLGKITEGFNVTLCHVIIFLIEPR